MSMNVQLHEGAVPYLVSPYESFFFLIHGVKLTVESGNGYPAQGGCFFGHEGRCYVSQYRAVFVSDAPAFTAYRSFSLPFYAIRDWDFHQGYFGGKAWRGHVNRVPGGGLVGVGRFSLEFLVRRHSFGFDEFRNHVLPLLEGSRELHRRFSELSTPSVLMVPAKIPSEGDGAHRIAFYAPEDPMTVFIVKPSE